MKKLHIHCNEITTPSDGNIFVEIDGVFFPENDWFDIPCGVISMWAHELDRFEKHLTNRCELFFMDGPFVIILLRKADGSVSVSFYDRQEIDYGLIDYRAFVDDLIMEAEKLIDFCSKNPEKCKKRDINELKEAIKKMKNST